MEDKTAQAVAILNDLKQKKVSYFDAQQYLLKQGFNQLEIDDACDKVDYNPKPTVDINGQPLPTEKEKLDAELEATDEEFRSDKIQETMGGMFHGL